MSHHEQSVSVNLPGRSYTIHIGIGLLHSLGRHLTEVHPCARATLVTDENVCPLYARAAVQSLADAGVDAACLTIPAGETSKSLDQAEQLYDALARRNHDRAEPIIALGGGVVGDLAGFVAATWLRGVPWVQCPTTLEAAIDAAIGGKTAVNHPAGKNLIGAFHQPIAVLGDVDCLKTLPQRDFIAALAESVKHAVIEGEPFLTWHEACAEAILNRDTAVLIDLIARNCRIKAAIVEADERESSGATPGAMPTAVGGHVPPVGRAALNLGHTLGHAIEAQSAYALRHGEAVSLGLVSALDLAIKHLGFPDSDRKRIESLLARLGLPVKCPLPLYANDLLRRLAADKKARAGQVRFILPQKIGELKWWSADQPVMILSALHRVGIGAQ